MNIYIDLDNTLCKTVDSNYENSEPIQLRIDKVNQLKEEGHHITIWTARGSKSGIDYEDLTKHQLEKWKVSYDKLLMKKPSYDIYLDDNQLLDLGNHNIKAMHTPGHTPGCTSYYIEGYIFTGDTLFIDGTGRTDFQELH